MEHVVIAVSDARRNFALLLEEVAMGRKTIVLVRHGRQVAAIVPVEQVGMPVSPAKAAPPLGHGSVFARAGTG